MAFKNAKKRLTTGLTTIYTCPAGKVALVFLGQVANSAGVDVDVTLEWTDASDGDAVTMLAYLMTVPVGAILPVIGKGALVLEAGDLVKGVASVANNADVSLSVVELDP